MEHERYPVIVLAGGKSTRLGRDKASEILEGRSLLQRAVDATSALASACIIVSAKGHTLPEVVSEVPPKLLTDVYPQTGPLGGIYTGLAALRGVPGPALVVACDMPMFQPALLRELLRLAEGHDAVCPILAGLPEPLCAVYSEACAEPARRLLERGAYKVAGLLEEVGALLVPETRWRPFDPEGLSFLNINRDEDLELARRLLREQAGAG